MNSLLAPDYDDISRLTQ